MGTGLTVGKNNKDGLPFLTPGYTPGRGSLVREGGKFILLEGRFGGTPGWSESMPSIQIVRRFISLSHGIQLVQGRYNRNSPSIVVGIG